MAHHRYSVEGVRTWTEFRWTPMPQAAYWGRELLSIESLQSVSLVCHSQPEDDDHGADKTGWASSLERAVTRQKTRTMNHTPPGEIVEISAPKASAELLWGADVSFQRRFEPFRACHH
jgi:hypothetical protein